jgi:hypothetical protein
MSNLVFIESRFTALEVKQLLMMGLFLHRKSEDGKAVSEIRESESLKELSSETGLYLGQ